jgi:tetratricopeptide (TPR) repeat protein
VRQIVLPNGRVVVRLDEPKGRLAVLFEQAAQHLVKGNRETVLGIYKQALKLRPNYFMTWTNLGSTLYALGRHDEAITALKKAIALNPVGYQGHWFLADAYMAKGKKQEALAAITNAIVINKNYQLLQAPWQRVLAANGLKLRKDRLTFPAVLMRVNSRVCQIAIPRKGGVRLMPLLACLAVWLMEPEFRALDRRVSRKNGFNHIKYAECLAGHADLLASHVAKGAPVTPKERFLHDVVKAGHLQDMVLWEIAPAYNPGIILYAGATIRRRVARYIRKFVYVPR